MDIELRNLTKAYGDAIAVSGLDLDIPEGELLVLLGPSGCGKTTTMRCIVGLEEPNGGTIRIDGQTVFDAAAGINVAANKRNVGMVFQSYAIWPHMSVADNVAFPLRMQHKERRDISRRVEDALTLVGLEGLGQRGASLLSGGQMQRVALARSIVMEPRILLLDEPLSNLDAKLRDRLRFELRALQQKLGITTVYVTHDQSEALALADRLAVMKDGQIVQLQDPVSMYRHPRNSFVADFLGASNLTRGTVVARSPGTTRVKLDDAPNILLTSTSQVDEDSVFVCIRPEDISLSSLDVSEDEHVNRFDMAVEVASFLGSFASYQTVADNGLHLQVTTVKTRTLCKPGTKLTAHVHPDNVQLLAD